MISAIRIHPADNVLCLLRDHDKGERPGLADTTAPPLTGAVLMGHKVALTAIRNGAPVTKYGWVIGYATQPIADGDHVHLHNLESTPP